LLSFKLLICFSINPFWRRWPDTGDRGYNRHAKIDVRRLSGSNLQPTNAQFSRHLHHPHHRAHQ